MWLVRLAPADRYSAWGLGGVYLSAVERMNEYSLAAKTEEYRIRRAAWLLARF
jgi:hypothetical protein